MNIPAISAKTRERISATTNDYRETPVGIVFAAGDAVVFLAGDGGEGWRILTMGANWHTVIDVADEPAILEAVARLVTDGGES